MASSKSKAARIMKKFNGRKFNLWKFKIKMLASMNLWNIVDGSEEASPSNADLKVLKDKPKTCQKGNVHHQPQLGNLCNYMSK